MARVDVGFLHTYRFIAQHPLTQHRRLAALRRWFSWQIGSRILQFPAAVPFVNNTRMLVKTGMTGATGNIYCGLHEFEDMAFVLHFLRPGDLFVDVGANVGSYTLLAAATGARVVSFEPVPATFESLLDNINLNRLGAQVDARNQAVGSQTGSIVMIADRDTTNKALDKRENYAGKTVEVPQVRLDVALRELVAPKLIKVDVEGFETEVMKGAASVLSDTRLEAMIIELNGSGARYGFDEDDLHQKMLKLGFSACVYEPLKRKVIDLTGLRSIRGNTLYVRDRESAQTKVAQSASYRVAGTSI